MKPSRLSGLTLLLTLVMVTSGCIGAAGFSDSDETSPDDPSDSGSNSPSFVILENATWTTTTNRSGQQVPGEYITLRSVSGEIGGSEWINLSGYTITYGDGPSYTISENVTLSTIPSSSVYLWTGNGSNRAYGVSDEQGYEPQYVLHAGFDGPLLDQNGTTITVANRSGAVVARKQVTPSEGVAPFVPTQPYEPVGSIQEAKEITPFDLRAPTDVPEGYQFHGFTISPQYRSYTLSYSREPNNDTDDFFIQVSAPRSVNESDRPGGSHPVMVGSQRGYYATQKPDSVNPSGQLQFIGPDGWGYFISGPPGEDRLVRIGESIEVVENGTTE